MTRFKLLALAGALLLAGCQTAPPAVVSRPVVLPLPPRPVLTPIPGSALQCLSDATYTETVNRERALKTWGISEEAVIKANNQAAAKAPAATTTP